MRPERGLTPPATTGILPLSLEDVGYAVGGTPLLSDITLRIEARRRLIVMGANGAGKSLFLRLCHGLIEPTTGRRLWESGEGRAEAQAMVFQRPVLLRRSVAANLDYPRALKGLPRADRREAVARTLDRFGLEALADRPARLLSGGEQALTATALIFAVFLTNPSPICVLDEVDAPLDDANVERYCDLLDEMAHTTLTRFLVITHNPITMARMDRLFGVTMAERGVSQLVSVDLERAERLREVS